MSTIIHRLSKMQIISRYSKTLISNPDYLASRSYYTNRRKKVTLYNKISPLGDPSVNLASELDNWVKKGNKIRFAELQRIVLDLRKRSRFSQALQVSEWMCGKGLCGFSPTEHAVQLDLIGKVHGFLSAEIYFNNLEDRDRTEKTYGALLHCYVRQHQTDKALSHLQKMKDLFSTLSPLSYNDIMCLYTNTGENEKVYDVLTDMKQNGVLPDIISYKICINSYGVRSDIAGMERILNEMESQPHIVMDWKAYAAVANYYINADLKKKANDFLKKAEEKLDNKDGLGHNHLITLHARLGNTSEVLRMWNLEKSVCNRCINKDYVVMLESLAKLGEFREAEKLLEEWESSGNCYDFRVPNAVISGFTNKGLYDKAKGLLKKLVDKKRMTTPDKWGRVATGFVEVDEMDKALYCMKAALTLHEGKKKWKPNPKTITSILNSLSEKASAEDVETFVALLRKVGPLNRQMYHTWMKAYIRDGKEVDGLLKRMKADKLNEDDETGKILSMKADSCLDPQNFSRTIV